MEIGDDGAVMDLVQNPVREAPKLEVVPVIAPPQPMAEIDAPVHQRAVHLATRTTVRVSVSSYDYLSCIDIHVCTVEAQIFVGLKFRSFGTQKTSVGI
jgi:hypothetical protein